MSCKLISIIIPIYNEEKNIPLLYDEIKKVWQNLKEKYDYEMIFVDDGSEDNSIKILKNLAEESEKVKILAFSKNFGHQSAIEVGLISAKGEAVIMMDGDLQHPPELIPELIKKWKQGFEIVNTKRIDEKRISFFKKITAKFFYALINKITNIYIEPGSADFRLMDKKAVDVLNKLPEKNKFYRGLINWVGFKNTSINYKAKKRIHGSPSYTFRKMLSLARIGITSFSMLPLKIILISGSLITLFSFILLLIMIYCRLFVDINYFSPLAFIVVFIVFSNGILLTCQGIISLYLINIYKEAQNRPNYIIKEKINFNE